MRVLVSTTAGAGHFGPLVPFARALRDAGHDVLVAAPACFADAVAKTRFRHHPFADASREAMGAVFAGLPGLSNEEANGVVFREVFGRLDAQAALPGIQAAIGEWRPDLVIREPAELASYAAAEAAGIPHVQVAVGLLRFEDTHLGQLADPLAELGAAGGVAGLRSSPCLSLFPELFDEPTAAPRPVQRFREPAGAVQADALPDWWDGSAEPLVYVSFGSVAATLGMFPFLYQQVAAALGDLPIRVLLTLGEAGDPELLGPLPANTHVERWWPQQDVMAHAAAMVGHGGAGSTLFGLAAGVPMVVLPIFADQPANAARVDALGAGIALEGGPSAVPDLPDALSRVLGDASFRARAEDVAAAVHALPEVADSVPFLEGVAAGASAPR